MENTTNYGLNKPESTDFYDVSIQNENMDTIDKELKKNADHTTATNNPHKVTASQVGLDNVPNVSTNDQTPTYTEATTLAGLTSGEKLSVALGKIAKAVKDLISHIANVNNPHSVTKAQLGLGNVNNTSDANKPVSTAQQTAIDTAYANSNYYTDAKIAELINGAPTTLDTLKEIADAMAEHEDVVEALNEAIGTKANESEFSSHVADKTNPHNVTKAQLGLGNVDNTADNAKNVLSASKLTTTRTISLTGDVTGSVNFDGSDNVNMSTAVANNSHTHTASNITAGTLAGAVVANATAVATLSTKQVRNIYAGTAELTAGTSSLPTGDIYIQYE